MAGLNAVSGVSPTTDDVTVTIVGETVRLSVPRLVSADHTLSVIWQLKNLCTAHIAAKAISVDLSSLDYAPSALMIVLEFTKRDLRARGCSLSIG